MALTKETLQLLLVLQGKDSFLDAIQKEIDAVPPRIAALKADLDAEKRLLDGVKARILELEKAKKSKELDVAAKEEAARKHGLQLNEVKTNEAYRALQTEIEKEKAAIGDIETEILQFMEEIDKARREEKAAASEYKKTEEFAKKDLEKLEAELSHARGRHAEAKADRDAAASPVPPELMRVYEHIRSRGKLDAIVPVVDGHCGSCQINLSPSMVAELAKQKTLVTCDSCQRILHRPEKTAPAAA